MSRLRTARELIEHASPRIAEMFRMCGEIVPMWHGVTEEDGEFVMPHPPYDKDIAAMITREIFAARKVVACVFISETWLLTESSKGMAINSIAEARLLMRGGLENHPDREEGIWYSGEDREGCISAVQMIVRHKGRAPKLKPLKWHGRSAVMEGRLVGMLPKRETETEH